MGRIFIFQLLPFSFEEYLECQNPEMVPIIQRPAQEILTKDLHHTIKNELARLFNDFLVYGGFPRVVTAHDIEEKQEILKTYILLLY